VKLGISLELGAWILELFNPLLHLPFMPIKVAIVEDDNGLRESLIALVKTNPDFRFTGAFVNAESALKQIPGDWPDVVLTDINLPGMSGIECVSKLKAMRPALLFVMLTVYMDGDLIFKSLQAGASGYLIKKTPPAEIMEALAEVHRGGSPMSSAIARKVTEFFQQKPTRSEESNLSKREQEILTELSKGYRDKEIADMLSISIPTVRTHVRHIYEKLQVRSRAEAVAKFLGGGDS
jgi:DNA-binding NarL/FixJ family response regulator